MSKDHLVVYLKHLESIWSRKRRHQKMKKTKLHRRNSKGLEFIRHLDEAEPNGRTSKNSSSNSKNIKKNKQTLNHRDHSPTTLKHFSLISTCQCSNEF